MSPSLEPGLLAFPPGSSSQIACAVLILVKALPEFPGTDVTNYHEPGGLKQPECILLVLEARSPKSRCWQGPASSEGTGVDPGSPLPAPDGSWHSLAYGRVTPISASVLSWSSPPCLWASSSLV